MRPTTIQRVIPLHVMTDEMKRAVQERINEEPARVLAIKRLIELHPDDFRRLVEEAKHEVER